MTYLQAQHSGERGGEVGVQGHSRLHRHTYTHTRRHTLISTQRYTHTGCAFITNERKAISRCICTNVCKIGVFTWLSSFRLLDTLSAIVRWHEVSGSIVHDNIVSFNHCSELLNPLSSIYPHINKKENLRQTCNLHYLGGKASRGNSV